jgi:EAL domain-containing protein (putative c-di-GMP-specific phosphodiesterase class I)
MRPVPMDDHPRERPHDAPAPAWAVDPFLRTVRVAPCMTARGDAERGRRPWLRYGPVPPFRSPSAPGTRRARAEFAAAVERRELRIEFQPIAGVASGRIEAFEALLRWRHPRRGLLRPRDFLGEAEAAGVLQLVTPFVLGVACDAAARWNTGAPHPVAVSVNLSGCQLAQPQLPELVEAALAEHELDPARLWFEITEDTGAREARSRVGTLLTLRRLGTRLALDDFGAGSASIACLLELPLDAVKLDRSLMRMSDSRRGARVLAACADIAHALGIPTVAEGIERADQLARVQALRCEYGQGDYFGRPAPRGAADRAAVVGWPWTAARAQTASLGQTSSG